MFLLFDTSLNTIVIIVFRILRVCLNDMELGSLNSHTYRFCHFNLVFNFHWVSCVRITVVYKGNDMSYPRSAFCE